jgi:hypothetical protein
MSKFDALDPTTYPVAKPIACDGCGCEDCHWKELLTPQTIEHCFCQKWIPPGALRTLDEESQ